MSNENPGPRAVTFLLGNLIKVRSNDGYRSIHIHLGVRIILCEGDLFQWKCGKIRTRSSSRYICEIIFESKSVARGDAYWFPI